LTPITKPKVVSKGISGTSHFNAVGEKTGDQQIADKVGGDKQTVGASGPFLRPPPRPKSMSTTHHFNAVNGGQEKKPVHKPIGGGGNGKISTTGHFDGVIGGKVNPSQLRPPTNGKAPGIAGADAIWVPTVQTMRDYVDYLIYVSNKYTFFKDLCKKHPLAEAQANFKKELLADAEKGLYSKYRPNHRVVIKNFVISVIDKVINHFTELYNDPGKTCSCFDILNKVPANHKAVVGKFSDVISNACPNVAGPVPNLSTEKPKQTLPILKTPNTPKLVGGKKKAGRVDFRASVEEIDVEIMSME